MKIILLLSLIFLSINNCQLYLENINRCLICDKSFSSIINQNQCSNQVSYCALYEDTNKCSICDQGRMLVNNQCIPKICPVNCEECLNNNVCKSCKINYYISEGSCNKCSTNCKSCIRGNQCIHCNIGYQVVNGNCKKIKCDIGKISYQIVNNQFCLQCLVKNCAVCKANNLIYCNVCKSGYIMVDGICQKNCRVRGCIVCNEKQQCNQCSDKYLLYNNQTCYSRQLKCIKGESLQYNGVFIQCQKCQDPKCLECNNFSQMCIKCQPEYKFNFDTSQCEIPICSIQNCLVCKDQDSCQICEVNYKLVTQDSNNICIGQEIQCNLFQYLANIDDQIQCSQCSIYNCYRCKDFSDKCELCMNNYYWDQSSLTCVKQSCSLVNCISCTSNDVCNLCAIGYKLISIDQNQSCVDKDFSCNDQQSLNYNNTNKTFECVSCSVNNCQICNKQNRSLCDTCHDGFVVNQTKDTCEQKTCDVSNCSKCLTNNSCLNCQQNYNLFEIDNTMKCVPSINCFIQNAIILNENEYVCSNCTDQNCLICQDFQLSKCLKCNVNYQLVNNQCQAVNCSVPNCIHCSKNDYCDQCQENKKLVKILDQTACIDTTFKCPNGLVMQIIQNEVQCLNCNINNCLECQEFDIQQCKICQQNYLMSEGQCYKANNTITCELNCSICEEPEVCLVCTGGYSNIQNKCVKEDIQCNSNQFFSLDSQKQYVCLNCQENCLECLNFSGKCNLCKPGFFLDNNNNCKDSNSITCNVNNCKFCYETNQCYECEPNYQIIFTQDSQNICNECLVNNCKQCKLNHNQICEQCDASHQLTAGGQCQKL